MKVKSESEVAQSCLTLSDPIKGCSLVEAATWVKLPLQEPGQSSLNDVKKSPALGKSWLKAPVH